MSWFRKTGDRSKGIGDRFKVVGGSDAATQPLSPTTEGSPRGITYQLSAEYQDIVYPT